MAKKVTIQMEVVKSTKNTLVLAPTGKQGPVPIRQVYVDKWWFEEDNPTTATYIVTLEEVGE